MRTSKDVRLKNQRHAALLLRRRIEELDQRLAILNSENKKTSDLWKSRSPGFVPWTTPNCNAYRWLLPEPAR